LSAIPGAGYAYFCVLAGAFITPLYIFRALFLTFHGKDRLSVENRQHVKESPWVILFPLIALAIPSVIAGALLVTPMLFTQPHLLGDSIFVLPEHDTLAKLAEDFHGAFAMALQAPLHLNFWLALAGIATAWAFSLRYTALAEELKLRFSGLYAILVDKYGFDDFNQLVIVRGTRKLGDIFYNISDLILIDGIFVNGSGRVIRWLSRAGRQLQTGYIYQYTLVMMLGLLFFMVWLLL
jgi:NADH-quinone oxidoreductase subunit L